MNELTPEKKITIKNPARGRETKALAGVADLINNPDFVEGDGDVGHFRSPEAVPDPMFDKKTPAAVKKPARTTKVASHKPAPQPVATAANHPSSSNEEEGLGTPVAAVAPTPTTRVLPERVCLTGRLRAGKDNTLSRLGFSIQSFAEPLYALQEYFFGTRDKSAPGAREFLQTVGQWGRGEVNAQYRLTPARAVFTQFVRNLAVTIDDLNDLGVDWDQFGKNQALWIDALNKRAEKVTGRIGVSNVRFENELEKMTSSGWTHFHVMCSPATWAKRLAASGLDPKSPALNDMSEKLAAGMDADSYGRIQQNPNGPKLRVIWADDEVRCPSKRFYTLNEIS